MANKAQRRLNRHIRKINKALQADEFLDLKRFNISQVEKAFYGCETIYLLRVTDSKSDEVLEVIVNNYDYARVLFWDVNNFIVNIRKKEGW